ncbi:MAG: DegT/DnrJ/EryC1/StrS family aminotransferase [Chloroflexi bacterium]|nr:DegT/DnrJ/EryC1/StrS family aminotransferase [Chloroflexota bacterium]
MQISLVDLQAQYKSIRPQIDAAIERVLHDAHFILGEEVRRFEESFARYVGAADCVGVASGTAAIQLALLACGVGPGDEVITTSHTFIATVEAIWHVGARPVLVDIDPLTYTLDPSLVEVAITSRTRAILPVHLYGQPADLAPLLEIAQRHNLWLIEDAAQAHGAEYQGKRCGTIGHMACFSFYPGKNLGAYGDAGAVTGNDLSLLNKVRKLRDHGRTSKYEHDELGYGERLDSLQAAVLGAKLPFLESWTTARREIASGYRQLLGNTHLVLPYEAPDLRHVYHLFVTRTPHREALLAHLQKNDIQAGVHYPIPVHLQPVYRKLGYPEARLPETEQAAREVLSLPLYPELGSEQLEFIAHSIQEFEKKIGN